MSVLTVVRDKIICTNEGHTKKKIRTRGNNDEVRIEVKSNIIARRSFGRVRQRKRNDNRGEKMFGVVSHSTEARRNETIGCKMKTVGERGANDVQLGARVKECS